MTQSPEEIKEKVTALVLEAYREQKPITKSVDEIMTLIEQVWNARTEEVVDELKKVRFRANLADDECEDYLVDWDDIATLTPKISNDNQIQS